MEHTRFKDSHVGLWGVAALVSTTFFIVWISPVLALFLCMAALIGLAATVLFQDSYSEPERRSDNHPQVAKRRRSITGDPAREMTDQGESRNVAILLSFLPFLLLTTIVPLFVMILLAFS